MSTIYSPEVCIGLDLKRVIHKRPRRITQEQWMENYKGFWPTFIDSNATPGLEMYFIQYLDNKTTIVYGASVFELLNDYSEISYALYKKRLARRIAKALQVDIRISDIKHYNTSTLVEIDGIL